MATSIPCTLCPNLFLVSTIIGSVLISHSAHATSYQVYPSEYAYLKNSFNLKLTFENASANCREYPAGSLQPSEHSEDFILCNGTQLKLADSIFGQEEHRTRDYYVWSANRDGQLLFIFPTTVTLTTITLHYYKDNIRGLPRVRFYAVPDDFDVWNNPNTSYPRVDNEEPPGQEPNGRRNVSINVNFNTKRVLMHKFSSMSHDQFEVSEVEFFSCNCSSASTASIITTDSTSPKTGMKSIKDTTNQMSDSVFTNDTSTSEYELVTTAYDPVIQNNAANSASVLLTLTGIGVVILIVLIVVVVITLVLLYLRKFTKSKPKSDYDNSYSTLCRRQLQPCSQQTSTDLYDQIQLSPSTGQAEVISNAEIENINSLPSHQTDNPPNPDKEQSRQSNVSMSEQSTYAAIKENKLMKGKRSGQNRNSAADERECSFTVTEKIDIKHEQKNVDEIKREETTPTSVYTTESPEALYTVIKKKPKNADNEDKVTLTPPYSVEELYTAIKDVKGGTTEEEGAPQVPLHTVEDLYTAVMKKQKNDPAIDSDTEAAPPIPPHTVEKLYAAVQKSNTVTVKDEEEAPPIPPHTVEELYAAVQKGNTVKDEEEAPPIPP